MLVLACVSSHLKWISCEGSSMSLRRRTVELVRHASICFIPTTLVMTAAMDSNGPEVGAYALFSASFLAERVKHRAEGSMATWFSGPSLRLRQRQSAKEEKPISLECLLPCKRCQLGSEALGTLQAQEMSSLRRLRPMWTRSWERSVEGSQDRKTRNKVSVRVTRTKRASVKNNIRRLRS